MQESLTVARPYAEAAFNYSHSESQSGDWMHMLSCLCDALKEPSLNSLVGNPKVADDILLSILVEVLGTDLSKQQINFLSLLVEAKRLGVVPQILQLFSALNAESEGVVTAMITSAYELSASEQEKLKTLIGARYSKSCNLETRVDLGLIGGAIIKIGDSVIDLSLRGRLAHMESKII